MSRPVPIVEYAKKIGKSTADFTASDMAAFTRWWIKQPLREDLLMGKIVSKKHLANVRQAMAKDAQRKSVPAKSAAVPTKNVVPAKTVGGFKKVSVASPKQEEVRTMPIKKVTLPPGSRKVVEDERSVPKKVMPKQTVAQQVERITHTTKETWGKGLPKGVQAPVLKRLGKSIPVPQEVEEEIEEVVEEVLEELEEGVEEEEIEGLEEGEEEVDVEEEIEEAEEAEEEYDQEEVEADAEEEAEEFAEEGEEQVVQDEEVVCDLGLNQQDVVALFWALTELFESYDLDSQPVHKQALEGIKDILESNLEPEE